MYGHTWASLQPNPAAYFRFKNGRHVPACSRRLTRLFRVGDGYSQVHCTQIAAARPGRKEQHGRPLCGGEGVGLAPGVDGLGPPRGKAPRSPEKPRTLLPHQGAWPPASGGERSSSSSSGWPRAPRRDDVWRGMVCCLCLIHGLALLSPLMGLRCKPALADAPLPRQIPNRSEKPLERALSARETEV